MGPSLSAIFRAGSPQERGCPYGAAPHGNVATTPQVRGPQLKHSVNTP